MTQVPVRSQARLIRPGMGRSITAGSDTGEFLVGAQETDGAFEFVLATTPPGGGPPRHVHFHADELYAILEGEMEAWTPDGTFTAVAGDVVFFPAGVPHAYRNTGDVPVRFYGVITPAGFEVFYRELAALFAQPGGPAPMKMVELASAHGMEILAPTEQ